MKVYDGEKKRNRSDIETSATMMIDGWTNSTVNTKNLAVLLSTHDGRLIFLGSENYSEKSENAENMLETYTNRFEHQAKEECNCIITSTISDNAANVVKFGRDSGLIHYTCQAHTGNLLLKDCNKKSIADKVRKIQVAFRETFLEQKLKKLSNKCVYLAGETRWKGQLDEYENFMHNRKFMVEIAAVHQQKISDDVMKLLKDEKLVVSVQRQVDQMKPIGVYIDFVQQDKCLLADAVDKFHELNLHNLKYSDAHRMKQFLPDVAKLSYLLHPKYKGQKFTPKDLHDIKAKILPHWSPSEFDDLSNYLENKGFFGLEENKCLNNIAYSPMDYWKCVEHKFPTLAKVGLLYSPLPSSTAPLERGFGYWGRIHCPLRNRFSDENSETMIYCYYSLTHNRSWMKELNK